MPPFFTIITATYNAAETLPRLLGSLAEQTCRDFMWVAQDGGSTDDTLAVIEAWRDRLPAVSVQSAPDKGIYDAWNKALGRVGESLGEWVLFMGADDLSAGPMVLERARSVLNGLPRGKILGVGAVEMFGGEYGTGRIISVDICKAFILLPFRMGLPHQGLFAARCMFNSHRFDPEFRIVGDHEWLLRVWRCLSQAHPLNFVVTRMAYGGISNTPECAALVRAEHRTVLRRYPPKHLRVWPLYIYAYCESLLFPFKMRIKQLAETYAWSGKLWECLRKLRKSWFDKV